MALLERCRKLKFSHSISLHRNIITQSRNLFIELKVAFLLTLQSSIRLLALGISRCSCSVHYLLFVFLSWLLWGKGSSVLSGVLCIFFLSGFFSQVFTIHGTTEEGEAISLTPLYHFHPLHRQLTLVGQLPQRAHICT